jgi:hypothetical protein
MPERLFHIQRNQHAVGHGFFHSARLDSYFKEIAAPFNYVYDCGAKKRQRLLSPAVRSYVDALGSEAIDLLVLSHFHGDHTNGLDMLLARTKIRSAIIPYVSPEERLLLIAHSLTRPMVRLDDVLFMADPGGWLRSRDVAQIITVQRGPAEPPPDVPTDAANVAPANGWELRIGGPSGPRLTDKGIVDHRSTVAVTNAGLGALDLRFYCWNRAALAPKLSQELRSIVAPEDLSLLRPEASIELIRNPSKRKQLIACYDRILNNRNLNWSTLCLLSRPPNPRDGGWTSWFTTGRSPKSTRTHISRQEGWLGTGDLELKQSTVSKEFYNHFSDVVGVSTLSLPHHGSWDNYDPDLLLRFKPTLVFATCPAHSTHHPNARTVAAVAQRAAWHVVDEAQENELHEMSDYFGVED